MRGIHGITWHTSHTCANVLVGEAQDRTDNLIAPAVLGGVHVLIGQPEQAFKVFQVGAGRQSEAVVATRKSG